MIKKLTTLLLFIAIGVLIQSCNKNFEEIDNFESDLQNNKNFATNLSFSAHILNDDHPIVKSGINSHISDTLSQLIIMKEYVEFIENKWYLHISLEDAMKLGVSNSVYNTIFESMNQVNNFIDSVITENKKRNFVRLDNGIRPLYTIKTRSEGGGCVPLPNPFINVHETAELSAGMNMSFAGPYKVKATTYVQSMGIWGFTMEDEIYSGNIRANHSGFGPYDTIDHFVYPLVPQNGVCSWCIRINMSAANNSKITTTFTNDL